MKFYQYTLTGILALSLTSCEVETPDGRIPSEHAQQAQSYLGSYRGNIGEQSGTLSLSLLDTNRAIALFSNDVVANGCNSNIGQLESIDVNSSKETLKGANFSLSSDCIIAGDRINFSFRGNGKIVASYLKEIRREWRCHNLAQANTPRREPPHEPRPPDCGYENIHYYSTGTLNKIN